MDPPQKLNPPDQNDPEMHPPLCASKIVKFSRAGRHLLLSRVFVELATATHWKIHCRLEMRVGFGFSEWTPLLVCTRVTVLWVLANTCEHGRTQHHFVQHKQRKPTKNVFDGELDRVSTTFSTKFSTKHSLGRRLRWTSL